MPVARCRSSSGSTPSVTPASSRTFSSRPASTRPAMRPPTMAEEEEPKPEQIGTMLRVATRTGGMGTSPAYSKARRKACTTKWLDSPPSSTAVGMRLVPSPSVVMEKRSARSTVISFQMSTAMPTASKPGPMLAVVAGTRTTTLFLRTFAGTASPAALAFFVAGASPLAPSAPGGPDSSARSLRLMGALGAAGRGGRGAAGQAARRSEP
mmetsp:Transcript_114742/g.358862  ORF Transcript_114742/g.358862 Transcript_114742/m.358862 type:complete len:209 (+) Transcript_114742:933-1559(+)